MKVLNLTKVIKNFKHSIAVAYVFLGLILLLCPQKSKAQDTKLFFQGKDEFNANTSCNAVAKNPKGDIIFVGTATSGLNGGSDALVGAMSQNGTLLWQRHIGGKFDDVGISVFSASDSSILIAGNEKIAANTYCTRAFVAKISATGRLVWRKSVNFMSGSNAVSVIELKNKSIILVGNVKNAEGVYMTYFIAQYSSNGVEKGSKVNTGDTKVSIVKAIPDSAQIDAYYLAINVALSANLNMASLEKQKSNFTPVWQKLYNLPTQHVTAFYDMIDAQKDSLILYGGGLKYSTNSISDTLLFISKTTGDALLGSRIGSYYSGNKLAKITDGKYALATINYPYLYEFSVSGGLSKSLVISNKLLSSGSPLLIYDKNANPIIFGTNYGNTGMGSNVSIKNLKTMDNQTPTTILWYQTLGESKLSPNETCIKSATNAEGRKFILAQRASITHGSELWVYELNESGNIVWETTLTDLTTYATDQVRASMIVNKNGDLVVAVVGREGTQSLHILDSHTGDFIQKIDIPALQNTDLIDTNLPIHILQLNNNYVIIYEAFNNNTSPTNYGLVWLVVTPTGQSNSKFFSVTGSSSISLEIRNVILEATTNNLVIVGHQIKPQSKSAGFLMLIDPSGIVLQQQTFNFNTNWETHLWDIKQLPNKNYLACGYTTATGTVLQPYFLTLDANFKKKSEKIIPIQADTNIYTSNIARRLVVKQDGQIWALFSSRSNYNVCGTIKDEYNLSRLNIDVSVEQTVTFNTQIAGGVTDLWASANEIFFTTNGARKSTDILVGSFRSFCPTLNLSIGTSCNDGDATTINDFVQTDCTCKGTKTSNLKADTTISNTSAVQTDFMQQNTVSAAKTVKPIDAKVYPNPANSYFEVLLKEPTEADITIGVYNLLGIKVKNINVQGNQSIRIDVADLPNGLYKILINEQNSNKTIQTIAIQR